MFKEIFRQLTGWVLSILIGFLIVNALCFFYHRVPIWISTPNGATIAYRKPYSLMLNAKEGFSISRIDKNGYSNPDKELADSYVLILGASHTVGKEIAPDKKYPVIVNDHVSQDDYLHVYSIALDGCFLPDEIKYFKSGITAFADSEAVVIDINNTDCTIEELKDALNQVEYDASESALTFYDMDKMDRLEKELQCDLPLFLLILTNMQTIKNANKVVKGSENEIDIAEYEKLLNEALSMMRSEYDNPIVFVYHPSVAIEKDGSISLRYGSTWDSFKEICEKNGIDIIDSGEDILKYYESNHKVPYGFWNTALGKGHLNAVGHEIIAGEIIEYLEERLK